MTILRASHRRAVVCSIATVCISLGLTHDVAAEEKAGATGQAGSAFQESSREWGSLSGRFVLKGDIPDAKSIDLFRDFADLDYTAADESLLVDRESRGVANVIVFVLTPNVAIHPDYADMIERPRVMKFAGPRLVPRILALQVNQPFEIENTNAFAHAALIEPSSNSKLTFVIPCKGNIANELANAELRPLKVRDPVHSLEPFGWLVVADHPYVAVTDKDGRFELKNLPAGDLEFQCWRERTGWLAARPDWIDGRFTLKIGAETRLGDIRIPAARFDN